MKHRKIQVLIAISLMIISITACAKSEPPHATFEKVLPSAKTLSSSHLRPHDLQYEKMGMVMSYSVRRDNTSVEQETRLITIAFDHTPNAEPDRIWIDSSSLAFRKRLLVLKDYTIDVSMLANQFSGKLTPSEGSSYTPVVYNKEYAHDAFEPAIINYAIAALPLAIGYQASIPVFDLNNGSQMFWSNITVLAEEIVEIEGARFSCWKVESNGIRDKTLWISKDNGLAVKMKTKGNAGAWKIKPSSIVYQ